MKYFLSILLIIITGNSFAQQLTTWKLYDLHQGNYKNATVQSYTTEDDARAIIKNIIAVLGLQPKFEIKEATIPNAAAVIYASKRYILYNPRFVSSLNKAAGNQWASVSILAHEIGHHLNGHTLEAGGSRPAIELEADEFSGFVLRKMGASLQEAQVAMKVAASQRASHTHPAQNDRLYAIAKGWNNANNLESGSNNDMAKIYKKPPPLTTTIPQQLRLQPQKQVALIDKRYIAGTVHFNNDATGNYFVTTRNNLVKVSGSNLQVVGQVAHLDNAEYPKVIFDENKNYLLVSRSGSIVTTSGRKVGYLSDAR